MQMSFKDLRSIIVKCCNTTKSDDISSRFGFSIDLVKMENILKQKKNYLHVIGFSKNITSRIPDLDDLQMISEYVYEEQMDTMLDGNTQICSFMIFSKATQEGIIDISADGINVLTDKQIFDKCNGKGLDPATIKCILNRFPVYRVIVAKVFDSSNEKFEYKVYIRSNYRMVEYFKFLSDNPNFLDNLYEEEKKNNEVVESENDQVDETVTEEAEEPVETEETDGDQE